MPKIPDFPLDARENLIISSPELRFVRLRESTVNLPEYKTKFAARFDISASLDLPETHELVAYDDQNIKLCDVMVLKCQVRIPPRTRVLIPTGFIFSFHPSFELTLVARSGAALKHGLMLANSVGIIDPDYPEETFVCVYNSNRVPIVVKHNDRIAQGKLVPVDRCTFKEVEELPKISSNRKSGFGHTGR